MSKSLEDQINDFKEILKTAPNHNCSQSNTFDLLGDQIKSVKEDVCINDKSIKRLYTWQATVGISLLVFFLTVGVAALRFVDKIDFTVQKNSENIGKIEEKLEKNEEKTNNPQPVTMQDLERLLQRIHSKK